MCSANQKAEMTTELGPAPLPLSLGLWEHFHSYNCAGKGRESPTGLQSWCGDISTLGNNSADPSGRAQHSTGWQDAVNQALWYTWFLFFINPWITLTALSWRAAGAANPPPNAGSWGSAPSIFPAHLRGRSSYLGTSPTPWCPRTIDTHTQKAARDVFLAVTICLGHEDHCSSHWHTLLQQRANLLCH